MLKFSEKNQKTKKLLKKRFAKKWVSKGRQLYSFDLPAGYSCPFAKECKSQAVITPKGLRIKDGPHCKFRCFSASTEARLPVVYWCRQNNFDTLRKLKTTNAMAQAIIKAMPSNVGIVRIHVSGDFFNEKYFKAWLEIARSRPDVLFYAYTKAIGYWVKHIDGMPENLVLSASYGGIFDEAIDKYGLRSTIVVLDKKEAKQLGLPIDKSDEFAANPAKRHKPFAVLLHGVQPEGSIGAKIVRKRLLKG